MPSYLKRPPVAKVEEVVPKCGVKFTVAVQISPKIGLLLSQFMQQSMNFD
jgi:hypothetical protein